MDMCINILFIVLFIDVYIINKYLKLSINNLTFNSKPTITTPANITKAGINIYLIVS